MCTPSVLSDGVVEATFSKVKWLPSTSAAFSLTDVADRAVAEGDVGSAAVLEYRSGGMCRRRRRG